MKNSRLLRRKTNMGIQVLMVLFCLCSSSFAQVSKNLFPENKHENKRIDENNHVSYDTGMVNQSKYTTAFTSGGVGGRSTGTGGNGNGGQTHSSPQGGGNDVVPVYAAGSGGQLRNHKTGSALTYTPCLKGILVVVIATSASLILHILM